MKTIAKFSILLGVVLLAGFFGGATFLPSTFSVQRSDRISAAPEEVYEFIGHLDRWEEWTVWNEKDFPQLEIVVPGESEGVGATQVWRVADREGKLVITSAEAKRGISYSLTLAGQAPTEGIITFVQAGANTEVNWLVRGALDSAGERWIGLLLDGRLGEQLEQGLARLEAQFTEPGDTVKGE